VPDPFTLIIFGASGDLAARKLMPAVYGLFRDGLLPDGFSVVGYARTPKSDEDFRADMREATQKFVRSGSFDETAWQAFASILRYVSGSYDAAGFRLLKKRLDEAAARDRTQGRCLFDLATPPTAFAEIVGELREAGLSLPREGGSSWPRIIVEKPFGSDLATARELNKQLQCAFSENRIFRIDHYLGKETVQNLLVLRFANSIFEPLWNRTHIDHVQITVSESVGVEGRGKYYDHAGALRDILQNHMMHLLCLVAMEPPIALEADAVRGEKVKLLQALRPMPMGCVSERVVRAQYAAGESAGKLACAYRDEPGVSPDSVTETFVALKAFVDNPRWEGVPFYLRTGKRMPARLTEISIHYKTVPHLLFPGAHGAPVQPNVLAVRIQPNEGITLRFQVKVPGPAMEARPFRMDFDYVSAFGKEPPDAYERLLLDAALGDSTLFIRDDEVEAAWSFVGPIVESCDADKGREIPLYPAGTWGPPEADRLIEADGRRWEIMKRPVHHEPGTSRPRDG
jgi:glucose-6-phosphate 1-dehydrogenase